MRRKQGAYSKIITKVTMLKSGLVSTGQKILILLQVNSRDQSRWVTYRYTSIQNAHDYLHDIALNVPVFSNSELWS